MDIREPKGRVLLIVAAVLAALLLTSLLVAGCGKSAQEQGGKQVESVKLGSIFPMSGDLSVLGENSKNGMEMAIHEINSAGGIKSMGGAPLELVIGDSQGKPDVALSETQRLIQSKHVSAVIGTGQSTTGLAIIQTFERLQVPILLETNVANELTEKGYKYTFRSIAKATDYGKVQADFIAALHDLNPAIPEVQKAALIHEDSDYGQSMADGVRAGLDALGIEVTTEVAYPYDIPDLSTQLNKVKASDPDVVASTTYLIDAVVLAQARVRLNMTNMMFVDGAGGVVEPNFQKKLGKTAEGWATVMDFSPFTSDAAGEFASGYEAQFGLAPAGYSAEAYQAVYIMAKALETGGSADPKAVRDALATLKMTAEAGDRVILPVKTIAFGPDGQLTEVAIVAGQWQGSKVVPLFPTFLSAGSLKVPQ